MVGVRDLRRNVTLADVIHILGGDVERGDDGVEDSVHPADDFGIRAVELIMLPSLSQLARICSVGQSGQFLLQTLENAGDIVDRLFHFFVIALIGVGNYFIDLAVRDLSQDAIAFADGKQDGIQHGVYAAHNLRVRALELLGLPAVGELAFLWKRRSGALIPSAGPWRTPATLLTACFIFSWSPL